MKTFLFLCAFAAIVGCTRRTFYDRGLPVYRHESFGTRQNISELSATIDSNGVRTIKLKGFSSDQVEALGIVAEKAAEGAVRAMNPVAK